MEVFEFFVVPCHMFPNRQMARMKTVASAHAIAMRNAGAISARGLILPSSVVSSACSEMRLSVS